MFAGAGRRGGSYVCCREFLWTKTEGYESSILRVAASASVSFRAASFGVRAMSRVAAPVISWVAGSACDPVSRLQDSSARSAIFSSSGFVSYLLRFVCIRRCLRRAERLSFSPNSNDLVIDRFPTAGALVNAKSAQAGLALSHSSNKVNR